MQYTGPYRVVVVYGNGTKPQAYSHFYILLTRPVVLLSMKQRVLSYNVHLVRFIKIIADLKRLLRKDRHARLYLVHAIMCNDL